ncbi:MAG TPA: shikimate kinase [Gemmatimonadaceae bacterium]|nr:shikimate kinase [Gemmatimonadaceae bacterium]
MAKRPNIILVGLPGSGKTTTGRVLARNLHWPFIDFDTEIEHREHASVSEIFIRKGEAYFRGLEQSLTKEIANRSGMVISAGGGWITNRDSVALLRGTGRIIYLRVGPELAMGRLETARVRRPLLDVPDPIDTLKKLYEARRLLYEQADLTIDTEVVDRKEVMEQIRRYALSL